MVAYTARKIKKASAILTNSKMQYRAHGKNVVNTPLSLSQYIQYHKNIVLVYTDYWHHTLSQAPQVHGKNSKTAAYFEEFAI